MALHRILGVYLLYINEITYKLFVYSQFVTLCGLVTNSKLKFIVSYLKLNDYNMGLHDIDMCQPFGLSKCIKIILSTSYRIELCRACTKLLLFYRDRLQIHPWKGRIYKDKLQWLNKNYRKLFERDNMKTFAILIAFLAIQVSEPLVLLMVKTIYKIF